MWFFPRLRRNETDIRQAELALEEAREARNQVARREHFIERLTCEIGRFAAEDRFAEELQGVIISHLGRDSRGS